jgi:hypothetical protein
MFRPPSKLFSLALVFSYLISAGQVLAEAPAQASRMLLTPP